MNEDEVELRPKGRRGEALLRLQFCPGRRSKASPLRCRSSAGYKTAGKVACGHAMNRAVKRRAETSSARTEGLRYNRAVRKALRGGMVALLGMAVALAAAVCVFADEQPHAGNCNCGGNCSTCGEISLTCAEVKHSICDFAALCHMPVVPQLPCKEYCVEAACHKPLLPMFPCDEYCLEEVCHKPVVGLFLHDCCDCTIDLTGERPSCGCDCHAE